jgi:hypothetical protein
MEPSNSTAGEIYVSFRISPRVDSADGLTSDRREAATQSTHQGQFCGSLELCRTRNIVSLNTRLNVLLWSWRRAALTASSAPRSGTHSDLQADAGVSASNVIAKEDDISRRLREKNLEGGSDEYPCACCNRQR